MANVNVLDIMRSRKLDPMQFNFESIFMQNSMYLYLPPEDIAQLHKIATSLKLSSKLDEKLKMINQIMVARGFKKLACGTNRVVYRFIEDQSFVAKIALDRVGLSDNPSEYMNQQYLKPFVAKMFQVSPCGTVGFAEYVIPITRASEFYNIADDVFDILVNKILGKYVVEDIGASYFMNWGVRRGFCPVLLDYPYVYELDGKKLYCNKIMPNGLPCNGIIDYDDGFNNLICKSCGELYTARDLKSNNDQNLIIIEGGIKPMKVTINRGDEVICESMMESSTIEKPIFAKPKQKHNDNEFVVELTVDTGKYVASSTDDASPAGESDNVFDAYIGKKRNTIIPDMSHPPMPKRDKLGRFLPADHPYNNHMNRGRRTNNNVVKPDNNYTKPDQEEGSHPAPYYLTEDNGLTVVNNPHIITEKSANVKEKSQFIESSKTKAQAFADEY